MYWIKTSRPQIYCVIFKLKLIPILFRCGTLGDEGLRNINTSFKRLIHLRSFNLHFDWCSRITDNGVEKIQNAISCMRKLEKFRFSMMR